jgi:hypothetical protein
MNAQQLAEIQRQAGDDPILMAQLVVDYHLANTYNGNVNAYVDALGRTVDGWETIAEFGRGIVGLLGFLNELRGRGASAANLLAVREKIDAKIEAFKPPPPNARGARRRATRGRRGRKATRRGRR